MKKFILAILALATASTDKACDLCGCFTPPAEAVKQSDHGFYTSIAEQFTHFGSIRVDGHEVNDPSGQYLNSSITQLVIGQSFLDHKFTLQANLPYIYREYKRPEGFTTDRGNESGIGDISLLARYQFWSYESGAATKNNATFENDRKVPVPIEVPNHKFTFTALLKGGIKLPTGDSSRIQEEFSEVEVEGAPESGIHGHDLTLGTGSYDGIIGAEIFARYDRFFVEADTQFTLRGDGRYSYHLANDLTWSASLGYYLVDRENATLALAITTSGETKDTDRFQGRSAEDTGITAEYLGPKVTASYGQVSGEIGFELPILLDNTALQSVPDYRIRAAISIHF